MNVTPQLLSAFIPFETLSAADVDRLVEASSTLKLAKGAFVFKRGKSLDQLYYLIKGEIDLVDSQFKSLSLSAPAKAYLEPLNGWDMISSVSAVVKSDALLLVVERAAFDSVLAWSETCKTFTGKSEEAPTVKDDTVLPEQQGAGPFDGDTDWMMSLLQSPLFYRVPAANIQQLFSLFDIQNVQADEIIIRENERGDYFYVIERGGAIVMDKQQQILAALQPGQYFGEEALVGQTTRNATVKMLTPGRLMRLNKDSFLELLQSPSQRFVNIAQLAMISGDKCILDVRLPLERRHGSVGDSASLPLGSLRKQMPLLDQSRIYVVADDAGQRASVAAQLLTQAGFDTYILKDSQLLHAH